MTVLNGLNGAQVYTPAPGRGGDAVSAGRLAQPAVGPSTSFPDVIDGTPVRVVVLALSAAVGLTALRMAGFRFNVGVSA